MSSSSHDDFADKLHTPSMLQKMTSSPRKMTFSPSKKTGTPTSKHRTLHRTPSKKTRRPTSTYFEKDYYNRNIRNARANIVAEFVEFFKENFGEEAFTKFIWLLSTPVSSTRGYSFSDSPPSFLIDIMKEFFDLLKNTPELPQIAGPFRDIIEQFGPKTAYDPFSPEDYIKECNEIVDKFISVKKLDTNGQLAKSIRLFFSNVVSILINFIDKKSLQYNPEARIAVQSRMKDICLILQQLIQLINQNKKYHRIIQGFNVKDFINYGKDEREKDIKKLKEKDAAYYRDEYQISQGLLELAEERQEERDERRRQRAYAGQEGGRRLKMRSIKRRAYKKRSYKK
jgi:hypothetical protein